jgi:hypothetical protein
MVREEKRMRTASETIVIGNKKYEIAKMDFPSMTFTEARAKEDEHLVIPVYDVLEQIYQAGDKLGGFDLSSNYWCNGTYFNFESEHDPKDGFVQTIHFSTGLAQLLDLDKNRCKLHLVREIINEKQ